MTALLNQYALMLLPAAGIQMAPGGQIGGGGIAPGGGTGTQTGGGSRAGPSNGGLTGPGGGGGGGGGGGDKCARCKAMCNAGNQQACAQCPKLCGGGGGVVVPPVVAEPEQGNQAETGGGLPTGGAAVTKAAEEPSPSFLLLMPFFPGKATPGQLLPLGLFTQYGVLSPVGSSLFTYAADVPGSVDETVAKLTSGKFSRIFALPGVPAGVVWQATDGTLAMFLQSPIDATKSVAYSAALPAAPALPLPGLPGGPGQQSAAGLGLGPLPALPAGLPFLALPAGFPLPFPIPGTG